MFTNSNSQVSHKFTIIGLIAESKLKFINDTSSKIFGNLILEMKVVALSSLILKHYLKLTTINFAINQEKRVDTILKKLVADNSISEETKRSLKPVGTRPGIMYRLCKVTKISLIIALLFDLFCQQLILLPIN